MNAGIRAARYVSMSVLGALSCSQVLGIEDARVDPSLSIGPSAGENSTSGGTGNASLGGTDATSGGTSSGGATGDSGGSAAGGMTSGRGGNTSGGGMTTSEAGAGGAPRETLCDDYCELMVKNCVGTAVQYGDREQCMRVCDFFEEGTIDDPVGNTVACRLSYVAKTNYAAGKELLAYCQQAGPGGQGRCGSNCDGFCSIMMATCTAGVADTYAYPSEASCQSDCQTIPDDIPFEYDAPSVADGNSVGCRLFHVMSAAMYDAEEHCVHARGVTLCGEE